MTAFRCDQCGAEYEDESESCSARFDRLLALDHSRQEPWGSRHGQAFAAFALQHPTTYATSLDQAWLALYRIYVAGEVPARVFAALRARHAFEQDAPLRPAERAKLPTITVAHLEDFAANTYPERLDAWCRASLESWGLRFNPRETR